MKCCSAPSSRRPALPLHPLPPATVCKPKTKLKAKPNKFAPVVKYTTAENQEVKFESLLGEGTEVVLVRKKGAAREGVPPSHGVPSIEPGKKGELWVQVELCPASRPADALAGSKPIAGWVPRDSLRLPSLALNYEYLASELLEEPKRYPAAGSSQCARCNKILAERFLGHVAKVAYPLLGVGGAEVDREWSAAELVCAPQPHCQAGPVDPRPRVGAAGWHRTRVQWWAGAAQRPAARSSGGAHAAGGQVPPSGGRGVPLRRGAVHRGPERGAAADAAGGGGAAALRAGAGVRRTLRGLLRREIRCPPSPLAS